MTNLTGRRLLAFINANVSLSFGVGFYTAVYFIYYPPIFAFRDESAYLSMAFVLRQGAVFLEQTAIPVLGKMVTPDHVVSLYALGNSVLLIPFTFLGWERIFLYGLICHLLGVIYFRKLALLFDLRSPLIVLLYLFFPAGVFFSRTIMSDIPSATLFIAASYYYFHPRSMKWISGLLFGANVLLRATSLILIVPFALLLIVRSVGERRYSDLVHFMCPVVVFLVAGATLNKFLYGGFFLTAYSEVYTGVTNFSLGNVRDNLVHYLLSVMLVYPLMFPLCFFARSIRRPEIVLSVVTVFLFYSLYYFHDQFAGRWTTTVFGTRFLFPVFPFMLLGYGEVLTRILDRLGHPARRMATMSLMVLLASACLVINHRHQEALDSQALLKETIYGETEDGSVVIYDGNAAELVQMVWGDRIYVSHRDLKSLVDVLEDVDPRSKVYLVTRAVDYAGEVVVGMSREEEAYLADRFARTLVSEVGRMSIYDLTRKGP